MEIFLLGFFFFGVCFAGLDVDFYGCSVLFIMSVIIMLWLNVVACLLVEGRVFVWIILFLVFWD